MDIVWQGAEMQTYDKLRTLANQNKTPLPEFVKKIVDEKIQ
jgi:hypothetical protein